MELLLEIGAVVAFLCFVFPLLMPLVMFAMTAAWSSARVQVDDSWVRFTALDAIPCAVVVGLGGLASWYVWGANGAGPGSVGVLITIFLAASCRVRFEVRARDAEVRRLVLWMLPWRWASLTTPSAWEEGWGDFADPSALWIGDAGYAMEIGWWGQGTPPIAGLVDELNTAVAKLRQVQR